MLENVVKYQFTIATTFRLGIYMLSWSFLGEKIRICTKKIDLGFILDSSGSIGRYSFDKTKSFVKDLTNYFTISQNSTRVSVMSYATWSTLHFPFSRVFGTQQDLYSAIDNIPYNGGGTNTHQALMRAFTDMFDAKNSSRFTGLYC